jgi:homeobox-leucine zipper protein
LVVNEEFKLQLELGDDELTGFDYELHGGPHERTRCRLTEEQGRELELSFEEEHPHSEACQRLQS